MSTAKSTLKHHLESRVNYLVSDSRTFLWTRIVNKETFEKQKGKGIGGGNFLIVIGAFACLNLLSKIYWILSKNSDNYPLIDKLTQREFKKQAKDIKREVGKSKFELFFKYCSQGIKVGFQINEKEAFVNLVSDLYKDGINLGLKDDGRMIGKAWDDLRKSFAHYATPGGGKIGAFVGNSMGNESFEDLIKKMGKTKASPLHIEQDKEIIVSSDLLNQYLERINNWLSNKIDNASEVQVANCLKEIKL